MAICEKCGSINIVRARSGVMAKAIALCTGRKPFLCRRCGWRGQRSWNDQDLGDRNNRGEAPTAEYDPDMVVLDTPLGASPQSLAPQPVPRGGKARARTGRRGQDRLQRRRRREILNTIALSAAAMFVLAMLGSSGSCRGGSPDP